MRTVRAKFQCNSIEETVYGKTAKLTAIYGTEGENKDFTSSTPSGSIEIMISGDVPAANFFAPGKEVYVDFVNPDEE